jgi:hypothetical protein
VVRSDGVQAPTANTYGDVGRGVLYSPGQKNIDVSLTAASGSSGRRT